jgi:large subunit ribosomal protein L13
MHKYTIDAKNRVPGRIATEIAILLMGKNRTDYARNHVPDIVVEVKNASAMSLDAEKFRAKRYYNYSGYPGGLKARNMEQIITARGYSEVLRRAVSGMLPKNKLRSKMLKNLTIEE